MGGWIVQSDPDVLNSNFELMKQLLIILKDVCAGGRAICEALNIAQIPYCYNLAVNREMLTLALGSRLHETCTRLNCPPILHFSVHGNSDGIALTNGEFLSWHDLRTLLYPVTSRMQGGLLICMSSCAGAAGSRMSMYEDADPNFWALVGHGGDLTWSDAALAYISFYNLFFKGFDLDVCVNSMKVAVANHQFMFFTGTDTKKNWVEFMTQKRISEFLAQWNPPGA